LTIKSIYLIKLSTKLRSLIVIGFANWTKSFQPNATCFQGIRLAGSIIITSQ